MPEKSLDLSREFPRSPKERLGGYVHLARMIDKARAKAAMTIGDYIFPCPLDQMLLGFLGIHAEDFLKVVQEHGDLSIVNWLKEQARPMSPKEIEDWNRSFLNRKPEDEEARNHFLEIRNRIAPTRTDVSTWVDLLDLEEHRSV
jgi:hypothetical protein